MYGVTPVKKVISEILRNFNFLNVIKIKILIIFYKNAKTNEIFIKFLVCAKFSLYVTKH